jgi:hypothetical protein
MVLPLPELLQVFNQLLGLRFLDAFRAQNNNETNFKKRQQTTTKTTTIQF